MIPKEKQETNTKRGIQEREKMKERSGDLERIQAVEEKEIFKDLESMLTVAQATIQSCSNIERKKKQKLFERNDNKEGKIFHQLKGDANKNFNICVAFQP